MIACNGTNFEQSNRADVLLRINQVQGIGTTTVSTTEGDFLLSDVSFKGSVVNDNAVITCLNIPKNPNVTLVAGGFQDIVISNYTVQYIRADGRGVEGVDVPFAISGNVTQVIPVNSIQAITIIVVQHAAKLEPPLKNLTTEGGSQLLTVSAKITLYGQTTAGKVVSAFGYLPITFGDFAD